MTKCVPIIRWPTTNQQLMNSHYNIALLAECEQAVDAVTNTKSKFTSDNTQTNADDTKLKTPAMPPDSHSSPPAENTDTGDKSSVTGCVSPVQQ